MYKIINVAGKILWMLSVAISVNAQVNEMEINVSKIGAPIQSTMYGLFFEDINYGADGGLYAELVKNRSFEFPESFMGWQVFGNVTLKNDGPFERNPHYARLGYSGHSHKHTGLDNAGFFGIGVKQDAEYRFSVWARVPDGKESKIRVELINPATQEERQAFVSKDLTVNSKEWTKYELILKSPRTEAKARLRIFLLSNETVDLEHVSLFPTDTWKGQENGLRKDLVEALAALKPGVFRFPGGCIVEGTDLDTRYDWKKTVGTVENRPLNENRWHYTFMHRFFPDYFQTYGLGFYEFFRLSEDIGAEPLPVIGCGLACQFQNDNPEAHVPVSELAPYIQDALDLIEFANGDTGTEWGKLRAAMGHEKPFNLKYIAIGNEQWGETYPEHLAPFIRAIRAKYPDINIIGSAGPYSGGEQFDYLWKEMKRLKVDLVDEHFYSPESWFLAQGARYDSYDRTGPKIFAGEYACHGKGKKYNHFHASLLEAAFMTGLERNADIVRMATYAPLLAHAEGWQWRPDLIWFDNLRVMKSASYHVQYLYGNNKGTNILPLTMNGKAVSGADGQNGLFASAAWDKNEKTLIVKIVNTSDTPQSVSLNVKGLKKSEKLTAIERITLHAEKDVENTLENPDTVKPETSAFQMQSANSLNLNIQEGSFVIYRIGKE